MKKWIGIAAGALIGLIVAGLIKNVPTEEMLALEGQEYTHELVLSLGQPETVAEATNATEYAAYFSRDDFTVFVDKKSQIIFKVLKGRKTRHSL